MPAPRRIATLDQWRGLIMAVMAIDHVSAFVARRHGEEFWAAAWTRYDSPAWFLTRFVTHLCAPGFFFLMGAGMALLAASRQKSGWTHTRISTFLFKRGLLLLAVNQLIENPAWALGLLSGRAPALPSVLPGTDGTPFLIFTVLTGLGLAIMAAAWLLRFGDWIWWLAGLGSLLASAAFTPGPAHAATPYPLWLRLLFLPGQSGHAIVLYPLIPWFGLTALGVLFGRWIVRYGDRPLHWAPLAGVALIAAALLLRAAAGFGNLRLPRDASWIEFLNFIKYPPSLVFSLFMLGLNLILSRAVRGDWLRTIGQTPMFFYLAHLYLYAAIGALFFRDGSGLPALYAVWAAGLPPLYFACRRYGAFKASTPPDSFWRFF
ncbi:MAG: DUF1624 domain-containing protein [Bryobacteraceae bacterium]